MNTKRWKSLEVINTCEENLETVVSRNQEEESFRKLEVTRDTETSAPSVHSLPGTCLQLDKLSIELS